MKKTLLFSTVLSLVLMPVGLLAQTTHHVSTYDQLSSALGNANDNDIIILDQTIYISGCLAIYGKTLTIDLNGHTIDRGLASSAASDNGGVIMIEKVGVTPATVSIRNGYITGGNSSLQGGGIQIASGCTLTLDTVHITNCTTTVSASGYGYGGGAICNYGTLTIHGGSIQNCSAPNGKGGAIRDGGSNTNIVNSIQNCTIANNSASDVGGIYVRYSTYNLDNCVLTSNYGTDGCGAIGISTGEGNNHPTMTITGGSITGRQNGTDAGTNGGAIWNGSTLTLNGVTIQNCKATNTGSNQGQGGAIYNIGTLNISGGSIENCHAGDHAGAIWNRGSLTVANCTISNNTANDVGGIYNAADGTGTVTINTCTFTGNSSSGCGAIGNAASATEMTITGGTISSCIAGNNGGGIWNASTLTLESVTIQNCQANTTGSDHGQGGGIYNPSGTLTITDCSITGNTAGERGGGICNGSTGTVNVTNGAMQNNSSKDGGAIYNANGATMSITGGTYSGNSTTSYGGGAITNQGTLTMNGGNVNGNTSTGNGGGIYNNGTFNVSGSLQVYNNVKNSVPQVRNNVYLTSGHPLHMSGNSGPALNNTTNKIGVTLEVASDFITTNNFAITESSNYGHDVNPGDFFFADNGYSVGYPNGQNDLKIIAVNPVEVYSELTLNTALLLTPQNIKLVNSIDLTNCVNINDANTRTIDLNSYTINRSLLSSDGDNGHVFKVSETATNITITSGTLTGGYADNGGAVWVGSSAALTLNNVSITDCHATGNGGGIYNQGSLTVNSGSISGSSCGNSNNGGGIYHIGTAFTLTGSPIINNNTKGASTLSNVYLGENKLIAVTEEFGNNTSVGLTHFDNSATLTSGYSSHNTSAPDHYFFSDNYYSIELSNNEVVFNTTNTATPTPYIDADGTEKSAFPVYYLSTYENNGNHTLSSGWYVLDGGKTFNSLEIQGDVKFILGDGNALNVSYIYVTNSSTLTIYGQSGQTGQLIANHEGTGNYPGIFCTHGNTLIINGGNITAKGGSDAAGIGGLGEYSCGTVIINRGTVSATGKTSGAGIGGGHQNNGGTININGGTVTARGGNESTAHGIGDNGASITLNGGTIDYDKFGGSITVNHYFGDNNTVIAPGSYGGNTLPTNTTIALCEKYFVNAGNFNIASNWQEGVVPSGNVVAIVRADMTIPDGTTLNVNRAIMEEGGSITIKDGGQFVSVNPSFVTVEKTVVANKWMGLSPAVFAEGENYFDFNSGSTTNRWSQSHLVYDMFAYDETSSTWINQKPTIINYVQTVEGTGFDNLVRGRGYIYRNEVSFDLTFKGFTYNGNVSITLTAGGGGALKGFNLIGNPYTHELPFTRKYYSLNADGTWEAHNDGGTLKVGEAALVYTQDGESLILGPTGIVDGNSKGYLPPLPKGFCLGSNCDESDNQAIEKSSNLHFAYVSGDQLVINGTGLLQVFDVLGRQLFTKEITTVNSQISIHSFPGTGVYILRLNEKTQKIVVR